MLLAAGGCALCGGRGPSAASLPRGALGCTGGSAVKSTPSAGPRLYDGTLYELAQGSGLGIDGLDDRLGALAFDIVRVFEFDKGSYPSLFFFDDQDAPNCFQAEYDDPAKPLVPDTRGVVVMGRTIVRRLLDSPALDRMRGAALAGIAAHEFAHAYQRISGSYERLYGRDPKFGGDAQVRLVELHADFMAGFYIGRALPGKAGASLDLSVALMELGSTDFTNASYHGTPNERALCMYRGRDVALIMSATEAAKDGENFVARL